MLASEVYLRPIAPRRSCWHCVSHPRSTNFIQFAIYPVPGLQQPDSGTTPKTIRPSAVVDGKDWWENLTDASWTDATNQCARHFANRHSPGESSDGIGHLP